MANKIQQKEFDFFVFYARFISDCKRGKRLQPNGNRLSRGSIKNYENTERLLKNFCQQKKFHLRIRISRKLNQPEIQKEKNYWKKFYKKFTDYLYDDCNHFDNYAGQNIKCLRVFFSYLNKELLPGAGEFHKNFFVTTDETAIFPLLPEELNYLIYDISFAATLNKHMRKVKDFFVFGCTVALRVSDLLKLRKANMRIINNHYFLSVRSAKTSTDTLIRLPEYAIAILNRYSKQPSAMLPVFTQSNLNKYIKQLLEKAGFTHPVLKTRTRRGKLFELKCIQGSHCRPFRFCDVASTHTMRRTAITTMLTLGMPEQLVRKISGHSPGSKEF